MKVSIAICFATYLGLLICNVNASNLTAEIRLKEGNNEYHGLPEKGIDVHLLVRVVPYKTSNQPFVSESIWGTLQTPPSLIIESLSVSINSKSVPLLISSYSDLGEPRELSIVSREKRVTLKLIGSDAAGSYTCQWVFSYSKALDCYLLRKRIVQLNEFPQVNEATDFSYNERTDL